MQLVFSKNCDIIPPNPGSRPRCGGLAVGEGGNPAVSNYSFSVFPNENFLDFRLYQYGWEQCIPLHSFGPSVRNHYLFHYIISGQGSMDVNGPGGVTRKYELRAGEGFLICPEQVTRYSAHKTDPWKYTWLEFDGLRVKEYLESAGLDVSQPIYRPQFPAQGDELRDTMLYIAQHAEASPLHLIGHLCLFLDALIRSSSTRKTLHGGKLRDFYIQEAINYMEHNYQRELTVEEVADMCRLNRSYFSKLFRESMGCPPQEFLIRLRLTKAAEMMKMTTNSIRDIAAGCGYPNQLHFSRAFKKHYGISPKEWRNQNQR